MNQVILLLQHNELTILSYRVFKDSTAGDLLLHWLWDFLEMPINIMKL